MTACSSAPLIRPPLVAALAVLLCSPADPAAQNPQPPATADTKRPAQPSFRNEVNAVLIDARVTDEHGQFIRGLKREDFQLFEDGREQNISLYSLVDLPLTGPPAPIFAERRVERDVASNESASEGRLYLIVLDDTKGGLWELSRVEVRDTVHTFIEQYLTELDQVAVLTTSSRPDMAQEFTSNRRRTLETLDRFVPGYGQEITLPGGSPLPSRGGNTNARRDDGDHTLMLTLKAAANWMAGLPGRRKSIVVLGPRTGCFTPGTLISGQQKNDSRDLLEAAARGMATIYALAPTDNIPVNWSADVRALGPRSALSLPDYDVDWGRSTVCDSGLGAVARDTGGFALRVDAPEVFARIVNESSSHYLLGYTSTNTRRDGAFRQVEVRTTRPGVKVVARSGYTATDPKPRRLTAWSGVPRELTEVVNSPGATGGLTLNLAAPLFREKGSTASVAVILETPASQLQFSAAADPLNGAIDVFMVAANADGEANDQAFESLTMDLTSDLHAGVREHGVRLITKLELKPGRYQLRLGAMQRGSALRGGVRYDLDVPDFSKGAITMSGIALVSDHAALTPTVGPDNRWQAAVGSPPTAERVFSRDDGLRTYVEVYDNSKTGGRIDVATTVRDESGRAVFVTQQTNDAIPDKSPVYRVITPIPLRDLLPGQYLLAIEAQSSALKNDPVIREIPFSVR